MFPLFSELYAQNTLQDEIRVDLVVEPLLDKYGEPAVNEDGTFYPCDRFGIIYNIELVNDVDFEGIEFSYDSEVFNMFNSTDFNSPSGICSFEILPSASVGTYTIYLTAYGSHITGDNESVIHEATVAAAVQVVAYDPHFTQTLTYTIPTSNASSYDMPFAIIIRYEGNGPDYNLDQRAIIDNYTWTGYAQKTPEMDNLQQTLTPDLTISSFLNQTSNTQFLTQGIDTKNSQTVLIVDGQNFTNEELPKTFFWETNTNHTYLWTQTLHVNENERFEWQASITFPPQINPNIPANQSMAQEDLQNQLLDQINSKNGTLTTTPFGNTVTAMYTHNKDLEQIAKDTSVTKDQTLTNLNNAPNYFTSQQRYAKLQYQLNPIVTKELVNQNFTNNLVYSLSIGCDIFGTPKFFEANFTCEYEFFDKPINTTAYKWDSNLQNWSIDNTITIDITFESALNITTTDILRSNLEEQTTDPVALQMALEDLYDSGIQRFIGIGSIEANLKRTSPLYYNLNIQAGNQQKVTLQKTVQINFQTNNTYNLPLNFDPNSPLQTTVFSDSTQNTILQLDAPKELGGLTNITVYQITNLPNENANTLPKEQLNLKPLKSLELTIPQEQVQMPPEHEQFIQYYTGYSTILEGILGFQGQTQIAIQKDKATTALTQQGNALLYVEATNVWGTVFHQIIAVQPYSAPKWEIPFNQVTTYLVVIVIVAIILSFIVHMIRVKQ